MPFASSPVWRRVVDVENRVLLVEAEAPLRRSLEKFLERTGYTFVSCSSAREALLLADEFHPDVVIAEYRLPDSNGVVLLEKLKLLLPRAALIMISEYDFQAVMRELTRVNVRSFLQKPFDLAELEAALSSLRAKVKVRFPMKVEWNRELCVEGIPGCPASVFGK
jgi:two-component system, NtrC family, response regulator HydG